MTEVRTGCSQVFISKYLTLFTGLAHYLTRQGTFMRVLHVVQRHVPQFGDDAYDRFFVFIGVTPSVDPRWPAVDIGIGSTYDGGTVGGFCAWRRLWLA